MLDTVDFNHVQHISFTQSRLTDAVSVILSELLSYEHPPKPGVFHRRAKPSVTSGTRTARWYGLPAAILLLAARKRAFLA